MSILTLSDRLATQRRDEDPQFEIIDGQVVEMPPMGAISSIIAFRIASMIQNYALPRQLGQAVVEVLFHLALPVDRNRRPDAAFVSFARWPKGKAIPVHVNAWDVVPELGGEVVSPYDTIEELLEKLQEYFQAGMSVVWVVHPSQKIVYAYESLTKITILGWNDALTCEPLLPGFQLPLREVFLENETPANGV